MQTPGNGRTILLGEDEPEVRSYLATALKCHGYSVEFAEDGHEVLNCLRNSGRQISAVLLDILMPRKDGLETLRQIRQMDSNLPIIMLSSAASPLNIVDAMKNGATDFLGKPVSHEDLGNAVRRALDFRPDTFAPPVEVATAAQPVETWFAGSAPMREIQSLVKQIGMSEVPVLIQGETGVGKEILARQVHAQSPRAKRTFLKLNCAALPSELVESELFGYERGAFTGAFQKKPGMFEMADEGTLLLDEIGDMDFKLQAKLLQVLQDQEFHRLGGKDTVRVNVRVIAATHRDLEKAIAAGGFREDLYYRLNVMTIKVPALRERREEILPLSEFFLRKYAVPGLNPPSLTPALKQALLAYEWRGNIRELENVMRRFLIVREPEVIVGDLRQRMLRSMAASQPVLIPDTPAPLADSSILTQVSRAKEQAEVEAILAALRSTRWNRKQAASILKIDYKALLYKMKKLNIDGRGPEERSEREEIHFTATSGKGSHAAD